MSDEVEKDIELKNKKTSGVGLTESDAKNSFHEDKNFEEQVNDEKFSTETKDEIETKEKLFDNVQTRSEVKSMSGKKSKSKEKVVENQITVEEMCSNEKAGSNSFDGTLLRETALLKSTTKLTAPATENKNKSNKKLKGSDSSISFGLIDDDLIDNYLNKTSIEHTDEMHKTSDKDNQHSCSADLDSKDIQWNFGSILSG